MKSKLNKTLISSVPYVFIALFATKLGQTWRLADGITASEKFLHIADGFSEAIQSTENADKILHNMVYYDIIIMV